MQIILQRLKRSRLFEFEFLLFSLLMVLFNKIFVPSEQIYTAYIWPINMIILGLGSIAIYKNPYKIARIIFYLMFGGVAVTPFFAYGIFSNWLLSVFDTLIYITFYLMLFVELIRLITRADQVTLNVILGAVCGYLTLAVVMIFSFLLLETLQPNSFNGIAGLSVPAMYTKFSYFSMITLTTIGYGDITPATESAMLMASFYGITGQFYMVALVGIIISRYGGRKVMKS
jgi:hypothetical protein